MTTYSTQNPLGSVDPRDLYDNSQIFDHLSADRVNETWPDRLGMPRLTWYGMEEKYKQALASLGLNPVGTFQAGALVSAAGDIVQDETDDTWYIWDDLSSLPKEVEAGSTPESSGGIGKGKWQIVDVSDVLRKQLADVNSTVSIAGVPASQVGQNVNATEYAERDADVYDIIVVYGQSNALGSAALSGDTSGYPSPLKRSMMFDPADGVIKPITQGMMSTSGEASTGHAWSEFANEWYRLSGHGSVVINCAKGATSIAQLSKGASTGSSDYYGLLVSGVNNAKTRMTTQGMALGKVYVIFHQGEADQLSELPFSTYTTSLATLIDNLKTDILMTRFGNCTVGCPVNRQEYTWATIQNAQRYVCSSREAAVTVFDGCPSFLLRDGNVGTEGVHYTQRGYNTMGSCAARGLWGVENGGLKTKSDVDFSDYPSTVAPWARVKECLASARYASSTSSWQILNIRNGTTYVRPANINGVSISDDGSSLLFSVADNARLWFGFSANIERDGDLGLYAAASQFNNENFNIRVSVYIDLDVVVNISTGAVSSPRSGSYAAWIQSLVSASVSSGTAVLSHGDTLCGAQATHYGGTTLADTGATTSVNCPSTTQTRVYLANATTNPTVLVSLKRLRVTPAQLQSLGVTVSVRGVYAPDH